MVKNTLASGRRKKKKNSYSDSHTGRIKTDFELCLAMLMAFGTFRYPLWWPSHCCHHPHTRYDRRQPSMKHYSQNILRPRRKKDPPGSSNGAVWSVWDVVDRIVFSCVLYDWRLSSIAYCLSRKPWCYTTNFRQIGHSPLLERLHEDQGSLPLLTWFQGEVENYVRPWLCQITVTEAVTVLVQKIWTKSQVTCL